MDQVEKNEGRIIRFQFVSSHSRADIIRLLEFFFYFDFFSSLGYKNRDDYGNLQIVFLKNFSENPKKFKLNVWVSVTDKNVSEPMALSLIFFWAENTGVEPVSNLTVDYINLNLGGFSIVTYSKQQAFSANSTEMMCYGNWDVKGSYPSSFASNNVIPKYNNYAITGADGKNEISGFQQSDLIDFILNMLLLSCLKDDYSGTLFESENIIFPLTRCKKAHSFNLVGNEITGYFAEDKYAIYCCEEISFYFSNTVRVERSSEFRIATILVMHIDLQAFTRMN